jgi:hypothetical protein
MKTLKHVYKYEGNRYNMSDEALRLFLYGPARESFLGARATDNDKYPKRQLEIDDAVALLPVLHGVFRLNRSSVVPLQKPLLGLQLPEISANGRWNLRAKNAMAVVFKHMASLDIEFHECIHKFGTKTPLAEVLENINNVETALVNSLVAAKDVLVGNAVLARKHVLTEIVGQVLTSHGRAALQSGVVKDAPLAIDLTNMLQSTWDSASKNLADLPFEHKSKYNTDKSWSDFVNLEEFWKNKFDSETKVFAEYATKTKPQEEYQIDAAIASIRLGILFYKKVIEILRADNFAPNLLKKYYAYQTSTPEASADLNKISAKEKKVWERNANTFFKNLLIERFELLQANLYSFNAMTMGKGKRAMDLADSVTVTLVRSVTAPLFESTMADPYYRKDTQKQREKKEISEAELRRGVGYSIHVKRVVEFFNAFTPHTLTPADIEHIQATTCALFEPLPTIKVKSVHLRDLTYPSIEKKFTDVLTKRSVTEHARISGQNIAKISVSLGISPDNEVMQPFRQIILSLVDKDTNIVSAVTKHIVHAVGLTDSAFVATYYANDKVDLAAYHSSFPNLLVSQPADEPSAPAAGSAKPPVLLSKPAWITDLTDKTMDIIAFKSSLNIANIDSLFVFKNNPSSALTRPARPASAKSQKDGKKEKKPEKKETTKDGQKKDGKQGVKVGKKNKPVKAKQPDKKKKKN